MKKISFILLGNFLNSRVPESKDWVGNKDESELLMSLYNLKPVYIFKVLHFLDENIDEVKSCFNLRNDQIFTNPATLLAFYYLHNYESFLRENWPLSEEKLKALYQGLGYSFGNY